MTDDIHRRETFKAALLPLIATELAAPPALAQSGVGPSVVVYLSRSGNTRVLAGALARRFNADLFELRPRSTIPVAVACFTASKTIPAASPPSLPNTMGTPSRSAQTFNCPIAAARKVSPAASMTP